MPVRKVAKNWMEWKSAPGPAANARKAAEACRPKVTDFRTTASTSAECQIEAVQMTAKYPWSCAFREVRRHRMAGFEPAFHLVTSHFHAVPWVGAVGTHKVKSEHRIHAFNSIFLFLWSLELISELLPVRFLFVKFVRNYAMHPVTSNNHIFS